MATLAPQRQVFLDTETTGLHVENGDRIVELACVEMVNRQLTGRQMHHYVNPRRPSDADAFRVHGITDLFLAGKPDFSRVAPEVLAFIDGAEIVIHNASFVVGFFDAELRRAGLPPLGSRVSQVTDSLRLARELYPGKANSLDMLCRRLDIDASARKLHGALLDAHLLAEVYVAMQRGQHALELESDAQTSAGADQAIDLSTFVLSVIAPKPEELRAHESLLADITPQRPRPR
jgi:DNA polymerase-3 subunit epsilon